MTLERASGSAFLANTSGLVLYQQCACLAWRVVQYSWLSLHFRSVFNKTSDSAATSLMIDTRLVRSREYIVSIMTAQPVTSRQYIRQVVRLVTSRYKSWVLDILIALRRLSQDCTLAKAGLTLDLDDGTGGSVPLPVYRRAGIRAFVVERHFPDDQRGVLALKRGVQRSAVWAVLSPRDPCRRIRRGIARQLQSLPRKQREVSQRAQDLWIRWKEEGKRAKYSSERCVD